MINNSILNAACFGYSQTRRDSYFEFILTTCVDVYYAIINSSEEVINNENSIRDIFLKYLQCLAFKKKYKLRNLKFDPETLENRGRADIRVLPAKDDYIDDEAYYLIECKRLNSKNITGKSGLNAEYVINGICRFASNYYSSHFGCNAMFGFVVESVNIQSDVIDNINNRLNNNYINAQNVEVNANATQQLIYTDFANGYQYSYTSKHRRPDTSEITLYHLMFDFSKNIQ